jgi:hypothetical protein
VSIGSIVFTKVGATAWIAKRKKAAPESGLDDENY